MGGVIFFSVLCEVNRVSVGPDRRADDASHCHVTTKYTHKEVVPTAMFLCELTGVSLFHLGAPCGHAWHQLSSQTFLLKRFLLALVCQIPYCFVSR